MHVVGTSAAIWIATLILAFYVNDIMDWVKKKGNQNQVTDSTSGKENKSVPSSPKTSPHRSEKDVPLGGKAFLSVPGKGTFSWRGNGLKERTGHQEAGYSHV
jgi:hypothetical protein